MDNNTVLPVKVSFADGAYRAELASGGTIVTPSLDLFLTHLRGLLPKECWKNAHIDRLIAPAGEDDGA